MRPAALVATTIWALAAGPVAAAVELVMVEQRGCIYCKQWHADVGPEYQRTAEGRFAPMRQIDLHAPRPDDIAFSGPLRITPTFVLVIDGEERARIEGYPGEDFFWSLLDRMLRENTDYEGGT